MPIIITATIGWAIAQLIKIFIRFRRFKDFKLEVLLGSGGFPSAHTTFVTALSMQIGLIENWSGPLFALTAAFAMVVIYDSLNLRYSVGKQGEAINHLKKELAQIKGEEYKPMRVSRGHTPIEVMAGFVLGSIVALLSFNLWP